MKIQPNSKLFKDFAASETKADNQDNRTLVVTISTPTPDRSKDTVQPKGMVADNYLKNPVVQFAHKYDEPPIAKCINLVATETGIRATVKFPELGLYDKADTIYRMYKEGFLNAWSIGFMPLENEYETNSFGGTEFKKWELFEFSSVPVPDNPEALTIMRSKGINVDAVIEKKEVDEEDKEVKEVKEKKEVLPDGAKLTDLTVAEFKALLAEVGKEQIVTEEKIGIEDKANKAGRQISAKNEEKMKAACDHMKQATGQLEDILGSLGEDAESIVIHSHDSNLDETKSTTPSPKTTIDYLRKTLKKSDQSIGFAFRLLKQIEKEKEGKN